MQFLVGLLVLLLNPGCRYSFGFIYSLVSGQREGSGDWLHSIFLPRYSLSRICVISLDFPGLDLVTRSCGYAWLGATLGASPLCSILVLPACSLPPSLYLCFLLHLIMRHSKKGKSKASASTTRDQVQNVVEVAITTVTIVRDFVPLEPVKGALGALCSLLKLLQV